MHAACMQSAVHKACINYIICILKVPIPQEQEVQGVKSSKTFHDLFESFFKYPEINFTCTLEMQYYSFDI